MLEQWQHLTRARAFWCRQDCQAVIQPLCRIQLHLRSCSHVNYTASTSPLVQAKRVRTNRTRSFTRCYTLSVCIQFPLLEVQVCKSTKLTPAVLCECYCCAAFHWKDPDSLPGNSLSIYLTCCGMHLKLLQLIPQSTDKPAHKHTFTLLFTASGLLVFPQLFQTGHIAYSLSKKEPVQN